jgi:lipid A ethanolaminephosphotransferase
MQVMSRPMLSASREWNPLTLALLTSLWVAAFANWPLWRALLALPESASPRGVLFVAGFGAMIAMLTFVLLCTVAWRRRRPARISWAPTASSSTRP